MGFAPKFRLPLPTLIGLLGALVIAVPPLVFGWLPFLDLQAFAGMNAYPADQSYGPFHFYVFQLSYIGHHALCRLLGGLQVPVQAQVVLFYLLQMGVAFAVIALSLRRLIENEWVRSLAVAMGVLACWDGSFLWGGPLAFSLGACCLTAATFLTLREAAEPEWRAGWPFALLVVGALVFHPFALPFALALCVLRMIGVPAARWPAAAVAVGLMVFGWIILRDSPPGESAGAGKIAGLVSLHPANMLQRLEELFTEDNFTVGVLFGTQPIGLRIYFWLLGAVHLAGFMAAPFVVWLAREARWLRLLALLDLLVAVLYLCSTNDGNSLVSYWSTRVHTVYAPVMFLTGVAGPYFLWRRMEWKVSLPRELMRGGLIPGALLAMMLLVQIPIFQLGERVRAGFERTRAAILRSGVTNAYVVVSDLDAIHPYYLRCVPFLLFSDPEIVRRHLALYTEWHFQVRHPSRLAEDWFALGRARYLARFSLREGQLDVRLDPQSPDEATVFQRTSELGFGRKDRLLAAQFSQAVQLSEAGALRDAEAHYRAVLRLNPALADVHFNLALLHTTQGRAAEAREDLAAALRARPAFFEARLELGRLLLAAGKPAEATEQFEQAVKLRPESTEAQGWLKRATAIKSNP